DVDELAALFEPAVAKLQAAGCRVLIFTGFDPRMFPVIRLLRGRIAAYNMHLRGIADEHGCDLVDLWSMRALKDPRAWSPDRLHLATEGHRQVMAMIAVIPPRCRPIQQPTNGAGQRPAFCTAIRLSAVPASAASMATIAGAVSRQSVNTIPKATSGMVCKIMAPVMLPRAR